MTVHPARPIEAPTPTPADSGPPRPRTPGDEMGVLDAALAARPWREKVGLTIARVDRDGAEALARRHGYVLHVREFGDAESVWAELWPAG